MRGLIQVTSSIYFYNLGCLKTDVGEEVAQRQGILTELELFADTTIVFEHIIN